MFTIKEIDRMLETNLTEFKYQDTDNVIEDVCSIIDSAQSYAYQAVNIALVKRNWLIGYRIAKEELKGLKRAEYGEKIIKELSRNLTEKYGKGFDRGNLYHFLDFYKTFPQIVYSLSGQSKGILSWTHYRILLQVEDKEARDWYETEAYNETWSVRTLQRNVSSQYYYRLLSSKSLSNKREEKDNNEYNQKLEFVKNPIIAEFLGFSLDSKYTENDLETCIINNLQKFLMELGKGYAFVGRQVHIHTEKEEYYIDLVFYNYILKCFVLIDLKTSKIRHQDIGQMDMYVRMYDELKRNKDDNPTIGIVLCADTDEDIAKFSILKENEQCFANKYKLYLPSEEELRKEIENQKLLFELKAQNKKTSRKKI